MATGLNIADDLTLPLELVTSTQAILARKRSGKSYTASVEAEELLERKQQIIVVDPTSAWWGLRASADGRGAGYSVAVFGGDHADAPLDFRAGREMAAAVVEHGFSCIFDIGNLHTDQQIQFVSDLCSELLRINGTAIHVFMDEADTFAPQMVESKLQKQCLGTVSRLVKQGGIRGLGFTMITQRPADMNKKVLSQVDLLTVLRMSHPLDVSAATDWIKSEVTVAFADEVRKALPSLPVGTAFFCSASLGLGQRVQVRTRRTFNSGATPKPGERKVEPKVMAEVDIARLGEKIAASVKNAQDSSPEVLKARVAELEKAAAKTPMQTAQDPAALQTAVSKATKPFLEERAHVSRKLGYLRFDLNSAVQTLTELRDRADEVLSAFGSDALQPAPIQLPVQAPDRTQPSVSVRVEDPTALKSRSAHGNTGTASMGKACRVILTVLAQFGQSTRNKVAAISGYSVTSGSFRNTLSECRTNGWLTGSDPVVITPHGVIALGSYDPLPTGTALLEQWKAKLEKAPREILSAIVAGPLTREQIGEATGYAHGSGSFRNALSALRTLELIERGDPIRLHPDFAEAIRG